MKPLNGATMLRDGVQEALRHAEAARLVVKLRAEVQTLQGRLDACQTINRSMGEAMEQLRNEASVLAALHCQREGGTWELTEQMIAELPPQVEINLEATEHGSRLYRIVAPQPVDAIQAAAGN